MRAYLLRKAVGMVVTVLLVSTISFVFLQVIPGDPAQVILGTEASPEALQDLRRQLGLDRPLGLRYWTWLRGLLRGDLGESLRYQRPVVELLWERLPVTLVLAAAAVTLALTVALPMALLAARHAGTPVDLLIVLASQLGLALPPFWIGLLLIILFSLQLRWLPPGGYVLPGGGNPLGYLVLPTVALSLPLGAHLIWLLRQSILEVIERDFIRTARAKGLPENLVYYRHALRNALIPAMTVLGIHMGALLGGSIIIEQIFSLPGLGRLVLFAVYNRDWPLLQGGVVFIATAVVLINFVTDLIYGSLDPRISVTDT
ncbi:MAG: ABC transporter permease [Limnochordia bacterium]|jgi:peptide/nickel transport system permease protein|nr:ABC transporter permease [Bacillota bacterium]